jgi:hypothetical protein
VCGGDIEACNDDKDPLILLLWAIDQRVDLVQIFAFLSSNWYFRAVVPHKLTSDVNSRESRHARVWTDQTMRVDCAREDSISCAERLFGSEIGLEEAPCLAEGDSQENHREFVEWGSRGHYKLVC